MDLTKTQNIFIVGIKGVAMANLAVIFKKMGKNVTGSDVSSEFITDNLLRKHDIAVITNFEEFSIPEGADLIIYSGAHGGVSNPQIVAAYEKKIRCRSQSEVLGDLMALFKTSIAVCGTHGKTTTSALLSYALLKLGTNPSYIIGAPSFTDYEGSDFLGKDYFVVEADEYGVNPPQDKTIKFLHLKPTYILATNIGFDHPDIFDSVDGVRRAFLEFFGFTPLVVCVDDEDLMKTVRDLSKSQYVTYGFDDAAQIRILNIKSTAENTSFEIFQHGASYGVFSVKLFGRKNISNTAGVIAMLRKLGFEYDKIREAIRGFAGVRRRFEEVASVKNTYLFDDYAHHPDEIIATIDAARARFPDHKVGAIFQPHTYSRTKVLLSGFALALSKADYAIIMPIFASAREDKSQFQVTSSDVAKVAQERGFAQIYSVDSKGQALGKLRELAGDNQVVFMMGAGDVYTLSHDIIEVLKDAVK